MMPNSELLISLADCGSPEALIAAVLRHHADWRPSVSIDGLASEVGIEEIREIDTEAFEGALITDDEKARGVILVRAGVRSERRRFTVGHELGHFLIPTHRGNQQCSRADLREHRRETIRQRQETEANRFSAGMLMPKPWFQKDMRSLGEADVSHVQRLAKVYETSLEATVNRYAELTDDTCAFVFSKDGMVRYIRRSTNFPWMTVKRGDQLPSECGTLRWKGAVHQASEWHEVDEDVWLAAERDRGPAKVLEQCVRQSGGYSVTLLLLDDAEKQEDEDEDEALQASWTPRFHRR